MIESGDVDICVPYSREHEAPTCDHVLWSHIIRSTDVESQGIMNLPESLAPIDTPEPAVASFSKVLLPRYCDEFDEC